MNIEKLPSGNYRVTQMYQGKRYRITVDHKPSQKEAVQLLAEAMDGCEVKGTFQAACTDYINSKRNVLSPRTIREYEFYPNRLPKWFVKTPVSQIDAPVVQKCVNELAKELAPKTVRSLHGFISAVLGMAKPNLTLKTTLPRMEKAEPYIPSKNDVERLIEASEGTQYHIPIQLAFYGLRRGEICALEITDLDDNNILHINKDLVQTSSGEWIKKPPKTSTSTRDIPIDDSLAAEIRKQGYIFKGHPETITNFFRRTQDKLGMEHFSPHKMRHLFASILLDKGYDMKTIQGLGGWKGNETISKVYSHSLKLKDEEARKKIIEDIRGFLD